MTTAAEVDELVRLAHAAFEEGQHEEPHRRAAWLDAVAQVLDENADELIGLAHAQTRIAEAQLRREVARTSFQLRLLAREVLAGEHLDAAIDHADDSWGMGPRPDLRRVNVPLGVVGVFGASNFPFAFSVMGGDSASALAAGCSVVHKVHEAHEELGLRTGELVVQALAAAGAPDGLFATVTGREAGEGLVDHPLVQAVGFTGSTRVGRLLLDRATRREVPIPFYGELGSVNPVFVTERAWQARRDEVLTGYVGSFTLGMGQFCTKPGLLFVPSDGGEAVDAVRNAVAAVRPTPLLTAGMAERYESTLADLRSTEGVDVLVEGTGGEAPGPTVLTTTARQVLGHPEILGQEVFGPASVVVRYESEAELLQVAALVEGQLTSAVHAEAGEAQGELVRMLQARSGRVVWNGWPTGVTVSYAQHHGGPYPATTSSGTTSVGTGAVRRWLRPVAYQGFPDDQLPPALQEGNPWGVRRRVDGVWSGPDEGGQESGSQR